MSESRPLRSCRAAFTILELLVAMAVFAALAALAFSILSRVASTAQNNESRVTIASDFRAATDRLRADWASAIFSESHAPVFEKIAGNDTFRFFSHARPPKDSSVSSPRFSEVEYRVQDNVPPDQTVPPSLHRLIHSVGWTAIPGSPTILSEGEPLSEGIFRMEIAFLTDGGVLTNSVPPASSLRAVVIALAALDPKSIGRLSEGELDGLAGALADSTDGQTPVEGWSPADFASLPAYVRQNVRFSQRVYFLQ